MKKLLLLLILVFPFITATAQQGGWRTGEMEVKVFYENKEDVEKIEQLRFDGDIYHDGKGIFFVIPEELEELKSSGLKYEILKDDLNAYYKDFWATRDEYHSYEEIIQVMNSLAFGHPSICEKHTYGTSVQGRELAALKISDNVGIDEPEPEIGFDGGIHGDEIGGAENLIRFAEFLCTNYGSDPEITDLIDTREIWLYVMVNPDGRVNMTRENANGVDLNRDWGYMWDAWGGSPGAYSQPETKALRNWMYENQFVVHTTYHSGTEELVYAWSYRPDPTPDDAAIDQLAYVYVSSSGYSNLPYAQGYSGLYPINGSSKDTYYGAMGSIGWTMEISHSKQPPASQIMTYYNYNEPSMIAMIEYSGYGITGTVTDAETGEPIPAIIFVEDYFPTYTDPEGGDYHKYLLAGNYSVTAIANGYIPQTKNNISVSELSATTCDFSLSPGGGKYAFRIPASQIPDNNYDDEGNTPGALGEPDNVNYSIGKNGWVIVDMFESILDGPGNEIKIYEGDDTPEGYTCYASHTMDGPWTLLGTGSGTKSFDFDDSNLEEARFIKLVDDGDGPASADNAGFDLDAIEALPQPDIIVLKLDCDIQDPTGNNNGRIDPGETVDLVFKLRNHGGRTVEALKGNFNYDSAWISVPDPDVYFGSIPHAATAQATVTVTADDATPVEEIIMSVMNLSGNNGDYTHSFPCHYTVGAMIEDWETNSFEQFEWGSTNTPWIVSPVLPYEGLYSAKSANIDDNEKSGLTLTLDVIGYDEISFYRKVSSEVGFDFLKFYIDGVLKDQWSGNTDWAKVSYEVTPGTHTFKWAFEKDGATSQGYDCGWIDWITLPSFNISGELQAIANAGPHSFCGPGESQLGAYAIGGTGVYTFAWSPNVNISDTTIQFPTATPDETTVYSVTVEDGEGNVGSEIKVSIFPVPEIPVIEQKGDSLISSAENGNQWYNSNGAILGATGQVYYPSLEDTYYTIVTSYYGCASDTSNKIGFLFTDIAERPGESFFRVYPNPVKDELNIVLPEVGSVLLKVLDVSGRIILESSIEGKELIKVPFSEQQPGIYLISVQTQNDHSVFKVIK